MTLERHFRRPANELAGIRTIVRAVIGEAG
jgi:hypothetical protein